MMTQHEYWMLCHRGDFLAEKSETVGLSTAEQREYCEFCERYQKALTERWTLCQGYQTCRKLL